MNEDSQTSMDRDVEENEEIYLALADSDEEEEDG